MRRATTALLGTAATLLAACGTTTSQEPTPDPSATKLPITEPPADDPTGGVLPFPESTTAQQADSSAASGLVFVDVRVAEHEGFDRIVLEFAGTGAPGWGVRYVDVAQEEGSGKVVPLGGDALLQIDASNTTWPDPGYYSGPDRFEPENGGDVDDVYVGGTFEGYTKVVAGIDGEPVPFRAFTLSDPSRLVVDVVDER